MDPSNQVGRVLTLRVVIKDHDASRELWESFGKHKTVLGCEIRALSDGDLFDELDRYKHIADKAMEETDLSPDDDPWEITTKCGKVFYLHPYGIYSSSEQNYDQGEWFLSLEDLKEVYDINPDAD